jgi:hypothetical protein
MGPVGCQIPHRTTNAAAFQTKLPLPVAAASDPFLPLGASVTVT